MLYTSMVVTTRRFPRSSGFGVNTRSIGIPSGGFGVVIYYVHYYIIARECCAGRV